MVAAMCAGWKMLARVAEDWTESVQKLALDHPNSFCTKLLWQAVRWDLSATRHCTVKMSDESGSRGCIQGMSLFTVLGFAGSSCQNVSGTIGQPAVRTLLELNSRLIVPSNKQPRNSTQGYLRLIKLELV